MLFNEKELSLQLSGKISLLMVYGSEVVFSATLDEMTKRSYLYTGPTHFMLQDLVLPELSKFSHYLLLLDE